MEKERIWIKLQLMVSCLKGVIKTHPKIYASIDKTGLSEFQILGKCLLKIRRKKKFKTKDL